MKNLRNLYYPHHLDYVSHSNEFRPFITSFGEPNYQSNALNTDSLGFRLQYDKKGKVVNFYDIKNEVKRCNLMLGGSTVFGVDCSSDEKTFSNLLTKSGIPMFNWGVRGAVCQQELILYLLQKHLLPETENIIIFSGINDASLICLNGNFTYPEWGSIFSEDLFFRQYSGQYIKHSRKYLKTRRVVSWIEDILIKDDWKSKLLNLLAPNNRFFLNRSEGVNLNSSERFQTVVGHLKNCFEIWNLISNSTGVKIHYVLQPVLGWSPKKLSTKEAELLTSDIVKIPELATLISTNFYSKYRTIFSELLTNINIQFYDSNLWFSDYDYQDLFTDICHLNDLGNTEVARHISEKVLKL